MDETAQALSGSIRVGEVQVDLDRRLVTGPAGDATIEPKVLAVLLVLAEQPGEVVSRQELLDRVWPREYGGDESLSRAISLLRKALGDRGAIETVPKRGYSLIATVTAEAIQSPPSGHEARRASPAPANETFIDALKRRRVFREAIAYVVASVLLIELADILTASFEAPPWVLKSLIILLGLGFIPAVALAWVYDLTPDGVERTPGSASSVRARRLTIATALMAVGAAVLFALGRDRPVSDPPEAPLEAEVARPAQAGPPALAILPLTVAAEDEMASAQLVADGVVDDLLARLTKLPSLRVIASRATRGYAATDLTPAQVGNELQVTALLLGSVSAVDGRVRVAVRLVDVATEEQLWAETYDRPLDAGDLFRVQGTIAKSIAGALGARLSPEEARLLEELPTENLAAYRHFYQARQYLNRIHASELHDVEPYLEALRAAVAEDPNFTRAWAELVTAYSWGNQGDRNADFAAGAEQALERLQELAPGSAEHHVARASYLYYTLNAYDEAMREIDIAIAKQPGDLRSHELRMFIARRMGDHEVHFDAARTLLKLDPLNAAMARNAAFNLASIGRTSLALELLELFPTGRDYGVEFTRSWTRFSLELDPAAHLDRMLGLQEVFPANTAPHRLWYAHVFAGSIGGAEASLERIRETGFGHSIPPLDAPTVHALYTYRFAGDEERLRATLAAAEAALVLAAEEAGEEAPQDALLAGALVKALRGEPDLAVVDVMAWERFRADDAELYFYRPHVCFVLAMARARDAVIECLRRAAPELSWVVGPPLRFWPDFEFLAGDPAFEAMLDDAGR